MFRRQLYQVGLVVVALLVFIICKPYLTGAVSLPGPGIRSPTRDGPSAPSGAALAAARTLPVKGRAPKTGYSRAQFGTAWADTDSDGCDQREDVLNRDLVSGRVSGHMIKKTFDGCDVLTGVLQDPYTGRTIAFTRGRRTSAAVQIDHMVAESDAWQTGAHQWSQNKRLRFATDTLNLIAVDGPTNESKGDGDTAIWLPPNKKFRVEYVAHQVAIKQKYGLWVTPAEKQAMITVLSQSPTQPLPTPEPIPSLPGLHRMSTNQFWQSRT